MQNLPNGTGVCQPFGLLASEGGAEIGVTAASATDITADELIDLVYSLKRPYRKNTKFICNDRTMAAIRKLTDKNGRYLWQDSVQAGEPDRLLGYEVHTSPYFPVITAGIHCYYKRYLIDFIGGKNVRHEEFTVRKSLFPIIFFLRPPDHAHDFVSMKNKEGGIQATPIPHTLIDSKIFLAPSKLANFSN